LASCAPAADPEDVLGGGIEVDNQEAVIKQDDARIQAVQYAVCFAAKRAVARAVTP
jgi:LPS O-antigen subunit length determinant protein (WzzB/FepE family)